MTEASGDGSARGVRVLRLFSRLNIGGPSLHVILLSHGLRPLGYDTRLVVGRESPREGNLLALAAERGVDCETMAGLGREIAPLRDAVRPLRPRAPDASVASRDRPHPHGEGRPAGAAGGARGKGPDRRPHVPRPRPARLLLAPEGGALSEARGLPGAGGRRARGRVRDGQAGPRGAGRRPASQDPRDPARPRARGARGRAAARRAAARGGRRGGDAARRDGGPAGPDQGRAHLPSGRAPRARAPARGALRARGRRRGAPGARSALRHARARARGALPRLAPRSGLRSTAISTWS